MTDLTTWLYILGAVGVALTANSISAIWAQQGRKFTWWLAAVILISPIVFITFGLVVKEVGVAVGSGTIDSLLSISTMLVGIVFFKDHKRLSFYQYIGLGCIALGIIFLQFLG